MNLPNRLTAFRVLLVPVFCVLAYFANRYDIPVLYLFSGLIFIMASVTDMLDGYLARKLKMVTDFGKFMDPLADKMLTTAALLFMMREGVCSIAVLIIILTREFAVSGLRMLAASSKEQRVIPAGMWGKVKTVLQMVTIAAFYMGAFVLEANGIFRVCVSVACWICACAAVISGLTYFINHRRLLMIKSEKA